jgi:hypothetical protein
MRQLLEGTSKATTTESASELGEGDLEDGAHSEKAFTRRFPNFKTGITPPLTINSNMDTEEQERHQELRAQAGQAIHKQEVFDLVQKRQRTYQKLLNTTKTTKIDQSELYSQ